ncbi:hypothetical protein AAG570_000534 [Ranatra chinensis]|uniref:Uncharacterized protein n=1 Tax=Ranatra chinensis TaxID=642074 RepID=A0ABD0YXC8_9HEMI
MGGKSRGSEIVEVAWVGEFRWGDSFIQKREVQVVWKTRRREEEGLFKATSRAPIPPLHNPFPIYNSPYYGLSALTRQRKTGKMFTRTTPPIKLHGLLGEMDMAEGNIAPSPPGTQPEDAGKPENCGANADLEIETSEVKPE